MTKKVLFCSIFLFAVVMSISVNAIFAGEPVPFEVTSITIYKQRNLYARFDMKATGLPPAYQSPLTGGGDGIISTLENCAPCFLKKTFRTEFGSDEPPNFFSGFKPSGYSANHYVKFFARGTSPDITLSRAIRPNIGLVRLVVPARIKGRIEIVDGNTLIAFDDDVDLPGTLSTEFLQYRIITSSGEQRAFDFKNLTFSYLQ